MKLRARLAHLRTAMVQRQDPRSSPRLNTPADILKLLEEVAATVQSDPFAEMATKARTVGHLATVALKAIEASNLAARVEMLEMVLKQRSAGAKS